MYVAVIGVGFVGLTLSLALAEKGVRVAGIEIKEESYKKLSQGIPTFNESGIDRYLERNLGKNFEVYSKLEDLYKSARYSNFPCLLIEIFSFDKSS